MNLLARVSGKGVVFLTRWEGFRSCPYRHEGDVWTQGYGTTSATGHDIGPGSPCINEATARRWLRRDLNHLYLIAVPKKRRLKQCELDALASFAYNLGPGAVSDPKRSTLARRLLSREAIRGPQAHLP